MSPTAPFGDWTNGAEGSATVHFGDFEKNVILRTSADTGRQLLRQFQAARASGKPQCLLFRCSNPRGGEEAITIWPKYTTHFYVTPEAVAHDHSTDARDAEGEDQ
jgi:hypothetical protein